MPIIGDSIEILEKPMTMGQIINLLAFIERAVWDEDHPRPIEGVSAERPDIAISIGLQKIPPSRPVGRSGTHPGIGHCLLKDFQIELDI
jgi:hypothetical protein